jgi:hypothetical protein
MHACADRQSEARPLQVSGTGFLVLGTFVCGMRSRDMLETAHSLTWLGPYKWAARCWMELICIALMPARV